MKSSRRTSGECLRCSQNIGDDDEALLRYKHKPYGWVILVFRHMSSLSSTRAYKGNWLAVT